MPAARTRPVGAPVWIELGTRDPEAARAFYGAALGLDASPPAAEFGGYRNLLLGGEPVAGVMSVQPADPSGWFVYLRTDDVDAAVTAVTEHGGAAALPPMDVGELGRMAWVTDPSGAMVGLWQAGAFRGTAVEDVPGAPVGWELRAAERYPETVAFYERALGWGAVVVADTDETRTVTYGEGAGAWAAIVDDASPGRAPSGWRVTFAVDDADAAASRVAEGGGTILVEPTDTARGRVAEVLDPEGARFGLLQPRAP